MIQLNPFVGDISAICTPIELQQLLFGEATEVLYSIIEEVVTGNPISINTKQQITTEGEEEFETRLIDPNKYRSLEWNKDKIMNFFMAIGDALQGENSGIAKPSFISPLEAYCDGRDPNVDPLRLNLSYEQIQLQYIDIIDSRISKINTLCDYLKSMANIERTIQTFFDDILQ